MRLAYIIAEFPKLSETFVAREVLGLRALGFHIDVLSFQRPSAHDLARMSDDWRALVESTIYIDRAALVKAAARSFLAPGAASALNDRLQQCVTVPSNRQARLWRACAVAAEVKRRGITHLHAHWPYASLVAALAHAITGIPYSVSVHAHEAAHENGHFPVIFETLRIATFCNRATMEYLLQQLPEDCRSRSYLIYHGVDVEAFFPRPLQPPYQPLRVLSAGRLSKTKGFDRLLAACAAAVSAGVDVTLTILGRGPCYDTLLHQALTLGFSGRLTMPGWVPHAQVRDYYAQAHVFAMMADTTYQDGLPNVILEAMACARPVVLSPLPAAPEAVSDGREGVILDAPDDIGGFVEALRRFAEHPDKLAEMGAAARARVETEHSAEAQIRRLAALFESQLAGGG